MTPPGDTGRVPERPMTPRERDAEQERLLREYLERLDRNQRRDPDTGQVRPRREPKRDATDRAPL